MRLTKSQIDLAVADGADLFLWDSTLPGFGVRVKPSGVRSFIVQFRNRHGRSRRVTIGKYGTLTLEQARTEARKLLGEAARGRDPRQERIDDRVDPTIAELARRYMEDHCVGRCKASTMAAHRWLLTRFILPEFGGFRIRELRHSDVDGLHQRLRPTPYNANRVLGLLRAMYGRATVWGLIGKGEDPTQAVRKFRERRRERYLSREELARLGQAISLAASTHVISEHVAAAFRLLVLTGCRRDEIRQLRWSSVDFDRRMLILLDHKSDAHGAKGVPLNEAAVQILRELPRIPGSPWVFPGQEPNRPIVNLRKPWTRVLALAGIDHCRLHDLRHSFASFAVARGISLPVVGALLGHKSPLTTSRYTHLSADPLHHATELVAASIGEALLLPAPAGAASAGGTLASDQAPKVSVPA